MSLFPFWILAIFLFLCIHRTRTFDGCLCVEKIANGLELPVSLVNANDGSNRIFVGELKGVVYIFYPNGTKLPEPFIDVSSISGYLGKKSVQGLTNFAFHPNFRANGLFYMLITTPAKKKKAGVDHYSNLFEFKISSTDKNKADPNYSRLVLQFDQPGKGHDAEQLLFGADNYLYIFTGDGNFQKSPGYMFSQDIGSDFFYDYLGTGVQSIVSLANSSWGQLVKDKFLGKVLRIDVDSRTGDLAYGIPPGNPFSNGSYSKPEIYALGLRNPWRTGMDAGDRKTGEGRGRIIIGDVGQANVEELDLLEKGANYGWNVYEGARPNCMKSSCIKGPGKFTAPIFSYTRPKKMGKSVIGGQFYRGCRSPKLDGIYLWGDYNSALLFGLTENKTTGTWANKEVRLCNSNICESPLQSTYAGGIISFGLDEEGEVYVLTSEGQNPYMKQGQVYRIFEPSQPGDREPCRAKATPETPRLKAISQHFPPSITNSKEATNDELEPKADKDNQPIEINSDPQPEAIEPKTKTTTLMTSPITTTPTTSPTPTTKPVPQPLVASPTTEPTPTEKGKFVSDGSVIKATKGVVEGDLTETMADTTVNDDDLDNVGLENPSSSDARDDNVGTKLSLILDIFKKGNFSLKETFAKFLGRLLARLYNADFSSQDDDTIP